MAVVEPAQPIRLPSALSGFYRLRQPATAAAVEDVEEKKEEGEEGDVQREEQEQQEGSSHADRLRTAAVQVALLAAHRGQEAAGGADDLLVPGHPEPPPDDALSWRRCGFVLDLSVSKQLAPPSGTLEAQQAQQAQPGGQYGLGRYVAAGAAAAAGGGGGGGGAQHADTLLTGTLYSRNCGIRLAVSLSSAHTEAYASKAVNYTLMISAVGFLQVLLLVGQMEAVTTPAIAARVSLFALAHQVGSAGGAGGAGGAERACVHVGGGCVAPAAAPPRRRCHTHRAHRRIPTFHPFLPCPPPGCAGCLPLPGPPDPRHHGGGPVQRLWHSGLHAVW